ncbi:MAG: formyl transferase [Candidatus Marinimicrobia bacterium]|nr:formyl transferase [Candidatus Neomarinimicrobiota bacterium]
MHITFLVNKDIESNYALNILTAKLSHHSMTIFLSDHVGKKDGGAPEIKRLKYLEQTLFNDHVFPKIEKLPTENRFLTFNELGERIGREVTSLNKINSVKGLEKLRDSAPDLIVSIRYGSIIKSEVMAVPPLGILNLHSGLLPQYRGVMATFWAKLNGEENMGCTLHYITDGTIDTGPIVSSFQNKIDPTKDYLSNVIGLYPGGCELIINALNQIEAEKPLKSEKTEGESNYYTFPNAKDFDRFKNMGCKLFSPSELIQFVQKYYHHNLTEDLITYE